MQQIEALIEERKNRRRKSALRWYHANKQAAKEKNRIWYQKNKRKAAASAVLRLRAKPYLYLVAQAVARSKKRGYKCDLTREWALVRWTGHCEVTGARFVVGKGQHPFSPSLDRIRPELGYTMKNCRFVLLGVNLLKHTGTDKDMVRIAKAILNPKR